MLERFFKSFTFAFQGFKPLWNGLNFRVQSFSFILVVIMAIVVDCTALEWLIILMISALVLSLEAVNTAIEQLCDFTEPEANYRIKMIKDMSAAAVLIASLFAVLMAVIIFIPKILVWM